MKRVRFAPSPTGPLHIGGLRTALFNYLYTKKEQGVFVLRLEDTDQNRTVKDSEEYIYRCLAWCNLTPDEGPKEGGAYGPYRQSERKAVYKKYIQQLIESGNAYYAFDTSEELTEARTKSEKETGGFKYNAQNRNQFKNSLTLSNDECKDLIENSEYVIRLKVEANQSLVVEDLIRGMVTINSNELEDKILVKKDGMPTYHFANVVDDYLMKITTVIRGEEWLPSLAIHQLLYYAFGWESPDFMHLPLILNPGGKGKLSKRDGDKNGYPVFPIQWGESKGYLEKGFLPEAHINYIGQLGWSAKVDNEIMSLTEMIDAFALDDLQKGGARFDYEKAKWINQQHIGRLKSSDLMVKYPTYFIKLNERYGSVTEKVVRLIKDRIVLLEDIPTLLECFIKHPDSYDEKAMKKITKNNAKEIAIVIKEGVAIMEKGTLKDYLSQQSSIRDIGMGAFMQVLRVAMMGSLSGPDLITMVELIGKDVTLERLDRLINIT